MASHTAGRFRTLLLLALGLTLWAGVIAAGRKSVHLYWGTPLQLKALGLAVVAFLIAPVRRGVYAGMCVVRHPSPRARAWTMLAVGAAATAYLLGTALYQKRDFFPKFHDEYMNLLQMQLLAHGHLWLSAHPQADFFESFHIFVKPIYASMHFPGTALLYVPTVWLGLPYWILPLLVAGACVGLVYRIFAQMIDGVAGLLGAVLMLALREFRFVSLMVMSNSVVLLLGLLMVWAYLRWRKEHSIGWAAAVGVLAGWAAITRPPDAICFALPLGIAMAWELWRNAPGHARGYIQRWTMTGIVIVGGAAPFLALQLVFNRGVTGSLFESPHDYYSRLYNPGVNYGLRQPDFTLRPATTLPQKQAYYAWLVAPFIMMHRPGNLGPVVLHLWLPIAVKATLPATGFLLLLPAGLFGLVEPRRWVLAAVLPLALGFYVLSVMISDYYLLFAGPAVLLLVLLGARQIERTWATHRPVISPALALMLLFVAIATLPEARRESPDQFYMPTLKAVEQQLATIQGRALVIFTYRAGDNYNEEPVYNIDAPWPDSARIVRAQDLGPRNVELFRYYAAIQPERTVYRFDRRSWTMERLGNVKDLADTVAYNAD